MIVDVFQLEHLKTLLNLRVLNIENNEFIKMNVHEQLLSNNLPLKLNIDQMFTTTEELPVPTCLKTILLNTQII